MVGVGLHEMCAKRGGFSRITKWDDFQVTWLAWRFWRTSEEKCFQGRNLMNFVQILDYFCVEKSLEVLFFLVKNDLAGSCFHSKLLGRKKTSTIRSFSNCFFCQAFFFQQKRTAQLCWVCQLRKLCCMQRVVMSLERRRAVGCWDGWCDATMGDLSGTFFKSIETMFSTVSPPPPPTKKKGRIWSLPLLLVWMFYIYMYLPSSLK